MHGQQFGHSFDIGSRIRYKCNECYTMDGASTIRCNQYGLWTAAMPTCTPKQCPQINSWFGKINLRAKTFGSRYTFVCHYPLQLVGNDTLYCQCDGKWSSPPPVCSAGLKTTHAPIVRTTSLKHCPILEQIENGFSYFIQRIEGEFNPGDRVEYACRNRYKLQGSSSRYCKPNKMWTGRKPQCKMALCNALPRITHGHIIGSYRVNDQAKMLCDEGYYLQGKSVINCQLNGEWSDALPKCISKCFNITCPEGEFCQYDVKKKQAVCKCMRNMQCPYMYQPICASDGTTYNNECIMKATSCRSGFIKRKVADGSCKPAGTCLIVPRGRCKARFTVYHFDKSLKRCAPIDVGGCHRSGWNGFRTIAQCNNECKDICAASLDTGPCQLKKVRYGYIPSLNKCQEFVYGGCYGNNNNFPSLKECSNFCLK